MKRKIVFLLSILGLLAGLVVIPAVAQVVPPEVNMEMSPGESATIIKTITSPLIPPKPDVYFLCDTTGSMFDAIANMKANATAIMASVLTAQPDAQFGVGNYKDYPYDLLPPFYHQQSITSDTVAVQNAINTWSSGGGADGPESALYDLTMTATDPSIGWRTGSTRIVVWIGDAPAHDPVPMAATGLGYDITEATATSALVTAGIRVIAVSLNTGGYPAGLDDDPNLYGGDYASAYLIVEDGSIGQATRITNATGGVCLCAPGADEVTAKILEGLQAIKTDIWATIVADHGLSVTLTPAVIYDVPSGSMVNFTELISADNNAPQCHTLTATVTFWANSYPKEGAIIGKETISVHIKDITRPMVLSIETMNPAGKKIPPAGSTTLPGPKGGMNEDGFYQLLATDNCDPDPMIFVVDCTALTSSWDGIYFGPFASGIAVKFTEAKGAVPVIKKIGSKMGQAGYVEWHITLPTDAVVLAVDHSGNISTPDIQYVPPPPK